MKRVLSRVFVCWLLITISISAGSGWNIQKQQSSIDKQNTRYQEFQEKVLDDFVAGFAGDAERLKKAMDACTNALKQDSKHAMAMVWFGAGRVFECGQAFESGDFQTGMKLWNEGLKKMDQAVAAAPGSPLVRLRRGETLLDVWQHDPMSGEKMARKAADDLHYGIKALPEYLNDQNQQRRGELLYKIGLAYEKASEFGQAEKYMARIVEQAPKSSAIRQAKNWLEKNKSKEGETTRSYRNVERFDLLVRADLFAAMGGDRDRYAKAMKICNDALKEDPNHAGALSFHGWGLLIKSQWEQQDGKKDKAKELWDQGIVEINRAVSLDPDNVGPMLVRGSIFINSSRSMHLPESQRDLMLALGTYDYEKVYDVQKEQGYFKYLSEHARGELLMGLADAWHRRGNMSKAKRFFELVVQEVPDSDYAEDATAVISGKVDLKKLKSRTCAGCH